jgi:hypothetical protein
MASGRYNSAPMRCVVLASLGVLLGACEASKPEAPSEFGGASSTLVAVDAGHDAEVQGDDLPSEAQLWQRLESGNEVVESALLLVTMLESEERHADALRALRIASAKAPQSAELAVASAGVLRDLGRRAEAIDTLCSLRDRDAAAFGPGLWHELAEMCCIQSSFTTARDCMRRLRATVDGADYMRQKEQELTLLENAIQRGSGGRSMRVRDLLGDLRGAGDPSVRLEALQRLLPVGGAVAQSACTIAVGDASAALRAIAVDAAEVDAQLLSEFCAAALSDSDASVRIAGARRATALPLTDRVALLVGALAAEQDAGAFLAIDAALGMSASSISPLDAARAADAAYRRERVEDRRRSLSK